MGSETSGDGMKLQQPPSSQPWWVELVKKDALCYTILGVVVAHLMGWIPAKHEASSSSIPSANAAEKVTP